MEQDYRKIIKFGVSSHVISLPNDWIKQNNLNKGDTIILKQNDSNDLVLSPNSKNIGEKKLKEITIDLNNKNINYFKNALIGSYINNYKIIRFHDKKLAKRSNEIRSFINTLAGLEVIEQTNELIVIKDFLNEQDVYFDATLRRTDNIIRHMLNLAQESLDKDHTNSINNIDTDVNRLCFLMQKLTRAYIDDPSLMKDIKLNTYELLNYYRITVNLEYFADEIKRVARLFRNLSKSKSKSVTLYDYFKRIHEMYLESMKAFHERNIDVAYNLNQQCKEITIEINDILESDFNPVDVRIVEKLKNMVISIKRTARITANICLAR